MIKNNGPRTRWMLCLCAVLPILPSAAWARPLPTDSRILTGKFKNGVTWMYRKHDNPPGKMALIVHMASGSLNETEAQRGLAHFTEHMAFNGTEHFAPGELIPFFESLGMEFGADLNAFTSFDQTAYMLFTPETTPAQIDKALMVLSDYVFRSSFVKEEIEKERGVVLEEKRRGKGFRQRMRDKLWPELFEGTRFAQRLPIGTEEVISHAPRKEFIDYYRTWYRPEWTTVILVGDAEPDSIIPLIKKWFSEYQPNTAAKPQHGPGFKPFTTQRSFVVTDPEMPFCDVDMTRILPARPPTTTVEQWRTELVEHIGNWIVGRRFKELINKGEASFRTASTDVSAFFNDAVSADGSARGEPGDWAKMLEQLVTEISRAGEHGFSQRELDLAKKELLADAEHSVKTEPTRNARGLLFQMVFALSEKRPMLSAQQELDLYRELLPTVQLAEVSETFQRYFQPGAFTYVVEMADKKGIAVPSRDEVLAAARAAWARKVKPLEQEKAPSQLLTSLPAPGRVTKSVVDDELGITTAQLANGVRVHHRFMDYKKDSVFVSIALAGGSIEETAKNVGITDVAALAINEAATNRLTSTNIRDIMTGKNINVRASAEGDSLTIRVTGAPEDLESGLQEVYALLTDGKIEESAFKNWKLRTLQQIAMREKMPMFKAFEAMQGLLSGDDPRQRFATKEEVEGQSLERAQAWFDRLRSEAPIEVAVLGDIKLDKAMPLVERYLGSLPQRAASAKTLDGLRKLARPTGPLTRNVDVETMTPQAMAIAGFAGCEGRNVADRRALTIATHILSSRLVKRIREDLSLVYSIRARNNPSWIYADAGVFAAGAPCDPKNADRVADEIHKMFAEFAEKGPTDDELENAKKQEANNLDTEMKEPRYWWRILDHHDLHGRNLDNAKDEKEAFSRLTAKQVQGVVKKYNTPVRQFRVTAIPAKAKTSEEKAKPATTPSS